MVFMKKNHGIYHPHSNQSHPLIWKHDIDLLRDVSIRNFVEISKCTWACDRRAYCRIPKVS